jgi:hypothetical protein
MRTKIVVALMSECSSSFESESRFSRVGGTPHSKNFATGTLGRTARSARLPIELLHLAGDSINPDLRFEDAYARDC